MHFINNRNEEIQSKILEFSADKMQQSLHILISGMWQFYCHSYFALISLCYMVIGLWTFSWMEPMCAAELTWYTLKVNNWGPYETYMMEWTCCTWDCLLEYGAHNRHITQIGIYFILRNNWHIDVPWNIYKIFYWLSFFLYNTWFRYWILWYFALYFMQIIHIANWCTWLAHTLCKGLI